MSAAVETPVTLLVCGNIDRCDDGAAIRASGLLLPGLHDEGVHGLEARRCGQLDIEHLLEVPTGAPTVIVDTAAGIEPGRVVTLTFDELLAHPRGPAPHSSHALPIDQVIGICRQVSDKPIDGLFVGVGGLDFGFGRSLSTPVRRAMPEFVAAISAAIGRLAARPAAREA